MPSRASLWRAGRGYTWTEEGRGETQPQQGPPRASRGAQPASAASQPARQTPRACPSAVLSHSSINVQKWTWHLICDAGDSVLFYSVCSSDLYRHRGRYDVPLGAPACFVRTPPSDQRAWGCRDEGAHPQESGDRDAVGHLGTRPCPPALSRPLELPSALTSALTKWVTAS